MTKSKSRIQGIASSIPPKKPTQFHDFKLKYFQCPYRRNAIRCFITNHFECIMNHDIFQNWISQILVFIFLIAFSGVLNYTHYDGLLNFNLFFNSLKTWEIFLNYDVIPKVCAFSISEQNFISVPISPKF